MNVIAGLVDKTVDAKSLTEVWRHLKVCPSHPDVALACQHGWSCSVLAESGRSAASHSPAVPTPTEALALIISWPASAVTGASVLLGNRPSAVSHLLTVECIR